MHGSFPTKESRRKARDEMIDKKTCTFKGDTIRMEKLIRINFVFPDSLPLRWQNRPTNEWLHDVALRNQCMRDRLEGKTTDGKFSAMDSGLLNNVFSHRDGFTDMRWCPHAERKGGSESVALQQQQAMQQHIDQLRKEEFGVLINHGIRLGAGEVESNCVFLTCPFRLPAMTRDRQSNTRILDRKSCSNCQKEELVTREYKCCTRCKVACYCGKECQTAHWKAGHKQQCEKPK